MSATRDEEIHAGNEVSFEPKGKAMPSDLQINKVSDQEIVIRLGGNSRVTSATVTPEALYEQLGKYLQNKGSGGLADDGCGINY